MKYLLSLILLVALALPACANSPTDKSVDDRASLQMTVQTFHRDMRWRRWESAAMLMVPEERQEFLGRYDELGDDYHISGIELKSLTHQGDKAIIDIEQESYKEPAMIVKKKRIIEVWEKRGGDWLLLERLPKDEYKERKKAEAKEEEATEKDDAADNEPAAE